MTVHQCPKCELRFALRTVLDDHCRNDHPEFHHDYPAGRAAHAAATAERARPDEQHPTSAGR